MFEKSLIENAKLFKNHNLLQELYLFYIMEVGDMDENLCMFARFRKKS